MRQLGLELSGLSKDIGLLRWLTVKSERLMDIWPSGQALRAEAIKTVLTA